MASSYTDDDAAFAVFGVGPSGKPGARSRAASARSCVRCGLRADAASSRCETCGGALVNVESRPVSARNVAAGPRVYPQARENAVYGTLSRTPYIILAIALGGIGIHNFYAHRYGRGGGQIALNFLAWALIFGGTANTNGGLMVVGLVAALSLSIWILIDIVTVTQDGDGRAFS